VPVPALPGPHLVLVQPDLAFGPLDDFLNQPSTIPPSNHC
jgi:hypothetical protein